MGQQDAYLRRPPPGYTGVRDGDTIIAHERASSYHTVGLSVLAFALCCATAAVSIHMYFPYSPMKLFPFTPAVLGVCSGVSALLSAFFFSTNSVRIGFACLSLRTTTTYTVFPWLNSDAEYPFSRLVVQEHDEPARACLRFKGEVDVLVTLGFLRPTERENEDADVERVTVGKITSRSAKWSKPLPLSDVNSHGIEEDEEEVSAVELVAFWRGYTNFLRGLVQLPALTQHTDPDEEVSVSLPSSVAKPQALPLRRALEAAFGILPSDAAERLDIDHDETCGSEVKVVSKISYLWIAFACVISAIFFRIALHDGGVTALVLIPLGVFVVLSDRKDCSTFDISRCVTSWVPRGEEEGAVLGYSDWSCAALFRQSVPVTRTRIDWSSVVVERSGLSDFHGLPRHPRDDSTPDFNADDKCPDWTSRLVDPCDESVTSSRLSNTRLRVVVLPAGQNFAARASTPSSAASVSLGVQVARSHTSAALYSSTTGENAANGDGEIHTESTVVPIAWGVYPSEAARTARRFERLFTGLSLLSERS